MENQEKNVPTSQENQLAMFIHLSTLLGFFIPFGNIIAPLIIWQVKKDQYPSLDVHGKEAVNFQISVTIYTVICAILALIIIGFLGMVAILVFTIVVTVKAALEANNGKIYHYPLSIKFIK